MGESVPTADLADYVANYDREIRYLDDALLTRWGDAPGLLVFTADHGESFHEHGEILGLLPTVLELLGIETPPQAFVRRGRFKLVPPRSPRDSGRSSMPSWRRTGARVLWTLRRCPSIPSNASCCVS